MRMLIFLRKNAILNLLRERERAIENPLRGNSSYLKYASPNSKFKIRKFLHEHYPVEISLAVKNYRSRILNKTYSVRLLFRSRSLNHL